MNKVILIGRVSNEPEFFDNGKFKNSKINIAVSEKFNDNEKTYFIPCVAWNHSGEFIKNFVTKGNLVSIEGKIVTSNYVNKEGKKVYKTEVEIERIESMEKRKIDTAFGSEKVNIEESFKKTNIIKNEDEEEFEG